MNMSWFKDLFSSPPRPEWRIIERISNDKTRFTVERHYYDSHYQERHYAKSIDEANEFIRKTKEEEELVKVRKTIIHEV